MVCQLELLSLYRHPQIVTAFRVETGEFTIFPPTMSEEERHIADLQEELARIESQIAQAGRAAGMTGMDMTADVDSQLKRKEELEKEIAEARKKLP